MVAAQFDVRVQKTALRSALGLDLFARRACQEGRPGKSARGRCLVDCGEQASVQREICLNGPARIADERHDREHSAVRQCRSHFGIGTDGLESSVA